MTNYEKNINKEITQTKASIEAVEKELKKKDLDTTSHCLMTTRLSALTTSLRVLETQNINAKRK